MKAGKLTVRQDLDNLLHLLLETDFQNPIRFVNDQRLDVLEDKRFRVLPPKTQKRNQINQRLHTRHNC
jgi:hypothetical protein